MANRRAWKVCRFSSTEFWDKIGCLASTPTFGLGGSRLRKKEETYQISLNKRKMH